ncbi:MAG: hypothetical protein EBV01_15190 [Betaproteobacteria bacterium]|nr:hypothetical protein [Betaproteobacteria bacterium]
MTYTNQCFTTFGVELRWPLKRIHRDRIKVNDRALHGVSTLTRDQTDLLGALTLQKPTKQEQLSLL